MCLTCFGKIPETRDIWVEATPAGIRCWDILAWWNWNTASCVFHNLWWWFTISSLGLIFLMTSLKSKIFILYSPGVSVMIEKASLFLTSLSFWWTFGGWKKRLNEKVIDYSGTKLSLLTRNLLLFQKSQCTWQENRMIDDLLTKTSLLA